jgi:hypothetical protein
MGSVAPKPVAWTHLEMSRILPSCGRFCQLWFAIFKHSQEFGGLTGDDLPCIQIKVISDTGRYSLITVCHFANLILLESMLSERDGFFSVYLLCASFVCMFLFSSGLVCGMG